MTSTEEGSLSSRKDEEVLASEKTSVREMTTHLFDTSQSCSGSTVRRRLGVRYFDPCEFSEGRRCAVSQRVEVVAAFEHQQRSACRHEGENSPEHSRVVPGRQSHLRERVAAMRIEACRHDQPCRAESLGSRHDDLVERREVRIPCRSRR